MNGREGLSTLGYHYSNAMSVGRRGTETRSESWEDYEKQVGRAELNVSDSSNVPAGNNIGALVESFAQIDPAGGLGRGEVAELVAMRCTMQVRSSTPDTDQAPVKLQGELEYSLDSEAHVVSLGTQTSGTSSTVTLENRATSDDIDMEQSHAVVDDYAEYLAFLKRTDATGAYGNDSTDTEADYGGAQNYDQDTVERHFREEFGQGPELDRHNEIHLHGAILENISSNWTTLAKVPKPAINTQFEFIWDVFEE